MSHPSVIFAAPPSLNLVVLRAKDLEAAHRFYDAIGLGIERHKHGKGAEHLAICSVHGSALLEIYPLKDGQIPTTSVRIGFSIDAVDPYISALIAAGGLVIEAPHDSEWGRRAVVMDPEGHKVELVTHHDRDRVSG